MLLLATNVRAQDCTGNVDTSGNICTTFTLGTPTSNCISVLTQDGQPIPQYSGAVCPNGFFGGAGMQITLPNDPTNPGYALTTYICTTAIVSDTVPGFSTTPQPPGTLTQSLSCTVNYGYYTATWSGLLDYNYVSVHQTRCSSGHPVCRTGYFPVWASGDGEIATPPPPPRPSPTPPVCGNGTIESGEQCDDGAANGVAGDCCTASCQFQPAGTTCMDEGDLCTVDVCDAAGLCTHAIEPSPTCTAPTAAMGASLLLRAPAPGRNDALFKWGKGPAVPLADFGDPAGSDVLRLCVYDLDRLEVQERDGSARGHHCHDARRRNDSPQGQAAGEGDQQPGVRAAAVAG
jgi:cysteine-rich repeat protein